MATTAHAAGLQAQVRYHLELGRAYASAAHPKDRLSEEAKPQARQSYGRALELARAARLDDLAIDAIHMFAFVDTAPADQLKWGRAALDVALASRQPEARRLEASIRNNVGYALTLGHSAIGQATVHHHAPILMDLAALLAALAAQVYAPHCTKRCQEPQRPTSSLQAFALHGPIRINHLRAQNESICVDARRVERAGLRPEPGAERCLVPRYRRT